MAGSWTNGVDRAFLYTITESDYNELLGATGSVMYLKDSPTFDGDVTVTGDLVVSGAGPHSIGGAILDYTQVYQRGTFTSLGASNQAYKYLIRGALTSAAGDTGIVSIVRYNGTTVTQTAAENIGVLSQLYLDEPGITDNLTGNITLASTLYIASAPTEGELNYALYVVAGDCYLAHDVGIGISANMDARLHVVAEATNTVGLVVEALSSASVDTQQWHYNGAIAGRYHATATVAYLQVSGRDLGNDIRGPYVIISRNTNAGAEGPVAGCLTLTKANNSTANLWTDAANDLRTHTAPVTGSSGAPSVADTGGTVVGAQTSWHGLKRNINKFVDYEEALDAVLAAKLYDFEMGAETNPHSHTGLVIYGKDTGSWFSYNDDLAKQQVPCLDERTIAGYTIASIKALHARIANLQSQIDTLKEERM